MATRIWRDEVLRLLRDEEAQLVEVLPPPEYEDEHIEGRLAFRSRTSTERPRSAWTRTAPSSSTDGTRSET